MAAKSVFTEAGLAPIFPSIDFLVGTNVLIEMHAFIGVSFQVKLNVGSIVK